MLPKDRDYDKKIFRLWAILNHLDGGKSVFTRELSEEFNVSLRTVQRDLELLNQVGFPLMVTDKGQHSFAEDFSLKRVMLSEEDASLLSFLYEISKSLGTNFEDSFKGILKKVLAHDMESSFYIKIPEGVKLDKELPFTKDLELAIEHCCKIKLCYDSHGEEKWYKADPLKIVFFDGFWYLLLRVKDKNWLRKFRLENIKKVEVLDEQFEIQENLKTMLAESVNVWFSEKRDKKVVLQVGKDVAAFFKKKKYFPLQKIKKEKADGSLTIESKVSDFMEVISTILYWIPHVKVISPQSLIDEIRDTMREYIKKI